MAFEAIPRTLAQNCGVNVIRTMTALQGKVMSARLKFFKFFLIVDTCINILKLFVYFAVCQHANGENAWVGIDGNSGAIVDMKERKVYLFNHHNHSFIFFFFFFLIFCLCFEHSFIAV